MCQARVKYQRKLMWLKNLSVIGNLLSSLKFESLAGDQNTTEIPKRKSKEPENLPRPKRIHEK